jgi:hypothetical protein
MIRNNSSFIKEPQELCPLNELKAKDARSSEHKLHQYYLYQISLLHFKEKIDFKDLFILLSPSIPSAGT